MTKLLQISYDSANIWYCDKKYVLVGQTADNGWKLVIFCQDINYLLDSTKLAWLIMSSLYCENTVEKRHEHSLKENILVPVENPRWLTSYSKVNNEVIHGVSTIVCTTATDLKCKVCNFSKRHMKLFHKWVLVQYCSPMASRSESKFSKAYARKFIYCCGILWRLSCFLENITKTHNLGIVA